MIIFHVFLSIIALLQTPGPDPEGIMTGIIKAQTLELGQRQACTLPTHLLIVPETSPEGNGLV